MLSWSSPQPHFERLCSGFRNGILQWTPWTTSDLRTAQVPCLQNYRPIVKKMAFCSKVFSLFHQVQLVVFEQFTKFSLVFFGALPTSSLVKPNKNMPSSKSLKFEQEAQHIYLFHSICYTFRTIYYRCIIYNVYIEYTISLSYTLENLRWKPKMEVLKMIFLFHWVIFTFKILPSLKLTAKTPENRGPPEIQEIPALENPAF